MPEFLPVTESSKKVGSLMATTLFSPRLFLSYSRADRDFAGKLATDLCRRGFRVFLDTSDIDPGDNFVSKLTKEIKRSLSESKKRPEVRHVLRSLAIRFHPVNDRGEVFLNSGRSFFGIDCCGCFCRRHRESKL